MCARIEAINGLAPLARGSIWALGGSACGPTGDHVALGSGHAGDRTGPACRQPHGLQRFEASGQPEASEGGVHSLPRFFHAGVTASACGMLVLVMALLSLKESTPGAYGLGSGGLNMNVRAQVERGGTSFEQHEPRGARSPAAGQ